MEPHYSDEERIKELKRNNRNAMSVVIGAFWLVVVALVVYYFVPESYALAGFFIFMLFVTIVHLVNRVRNKDL